MKKLLLGSRGEKKVQQENNRRRGGRKAEEEDEEEERERTLSFVESPRTIRRAQELAGEGVGSTDGEKEEGESGETFCNVISFVRTMTRAFEKGEPSPSHVLHLMQSFQFSLNEWKDYMHFDEHCYSRNLIAFDDNFSLMVICWNQDQETPVHDHATGERSWVKVLDGELTLTKYKCYCPNTQYSEVLDVSKYNDQSPVLFFDESMVKHKMGNSGKTRAVSVHLYSPPYFECCFNASGGRQGTIPVVYRPVAGLEGKCRLKAQLAHQQNVVYTSFDSLVDLLRHELKNETSSDRTTATINRISRLLASLRFNPKEIKQYAHFKDGHYTRNLVGYDEKFTLLLLCWEKGQASPIHDHATASCWMKVLQGDMEEVRYRVNENGFGSKVDVLKVTPMPTDSVAYIDNSQGVHKMGNARTDEVCISLHIYSPPYAKCFCFDKETGDKRTVTITQAYASQRPLVEHPLPNVRNPVPNLSTLVDKLCNEVGDSHLHGSVIEYLLGNLCFEPAEWKEYVHFSEHRYQRVLVAFNEHFSLVLICWNGGQGTPVHNHAPEGKTVPRKVWYRVLEGELDILEYSTNEGEQEITAKRRITSEDGVLQEADSLKYHQLRNASATEKAISLHCYFPPYIECCFKDEQSGQSKVVPVIYCSKNNTSTKEVVDEEQKKGGEEGAVDIPLIDVAVAQESDKKEEPKETKRRSRKLTEEGGENKTKQMFLPSPRCLQFRKMVFSNFQQFVSVLRTEFAHEADATKIWKLVDSFQFHPQEYQAYARFNKQHYTRVLVAQDKRFSLVMACWEKGQQSPIHDHSGSSVWLKVLQGRMLETQYSVWPNRAKILRLGNKVLDVDESSSLDGTLAHRMVNEHDGTSITLHLYAPPYSTCTCFTEDGQHKLIHIEDIFREPECCSKANNDSPCEQRRAKEKEKNEEHCC
ncbi:Cysteine dioxygenase [Balamuthia mandrillaris]